MDGSEFAKLAGFLAEIAYELSNSESVDEKLREKFLDFWRNFDHYNQYSD